MSPTTDYLVKLPKNQHLEFFEKAFTPSSKINMKIFGSEDVLAVRMRPNADDHIYTVQFKGDTFSADTLLTFKIEINLQIYFFKAKAIENTKSIVFDKKSDIYELIRRKETRYKLPKEWAQACMFINTEAKNARAVADIIEISASGMMVMLSSSASIFEPGQKIKLQFTIYRRSQLVLNATIKHSRKKLRSGSVVGIEFDDVSSILQSKIQNILDDLIFYYAAKRK
jgi:PilZ domain